MSAQSPMLQQASLLSGRHMVMVAIIALHALVISVLMTMRIMPDVQKPPPVITAHIDPPRQEIPPPPQELQVQLVEPRFTTDRVPVIDLIIPDVPAPTPLIAPQPQQPVESVTAPPTTSRVVVPPVPATALQYRAVRPANDYYPTASLTLQEEGVAIVQICVAPTGKLDGNPQILTSTGSPRLDAAALKWAREALRFTPATRDGVAVAACKGFRVNFTLH